MQLPLSVASLREPGEPISAGPCGCWGRTRGCGWPALCPFRACCLDGNRRPTQATLDMEGWQGCRPGGLGPEVLRGAHSGWRGRPTAQSLIPGSGQVLSGDTCYRGRAGAPQLPLLCTALGPGSSSGCCDCSSLGVPPAAVAMPPWSPWELLQLPWLFLTGGSSGCMAVPRLGGSSSCCGHASMGPLGAPLAAVAVLGWGLLQLL